MGEEGEGAFVGVIFRRGDNGVFEAI